MLALALLACHHDPTDTDGAGDTDATVDTTDTENPDTDTTVTTDTDPGDCLVDGLLGDLGVDHLVAGASMDDTIAASAPFDARYLYLSGGLFDGDAPCDSCESGCTASGASCANSAGGCAWWGCWQWDQDPPGAYARSFVDTSLGDEQIPWFTYYEILQASGASEGEGEVHAVDDHAFMVRYLADFRFLAQQIGDRRAFVHIEPDFWGYAEQLDADPHAIPAQVASADPEDCAGEEDSIAGLGACMIHIVRKYAPNAKVGLHGSGWATRFDVLQNADPTFDVTGHGARLGAFLLACGADRSDFVGVDASDRDAGYYDSVGRASWWDDTNQTLPDFEQAFTWSKAVAEAVGRPVIWWQVPVGNMGLNNTSGHWRDNRVDYFFAHPEEVAAGHGAGMLFGAGAGGQTDPSTDGGNLVGRVTAYAAAGGQAPCP